MFNDGHGASNFRTWARNVQFSGLTETKSCETLAAWECAVHPFQGIFEAWAGVLGRGILSVRHKSDDYQHDGCNASHLHSVARLSIKLDRLI